MRLTVYKDDIIDGLQKSANIIPAKTGAAYLRTIWLKVEGGNLSIMSTDSNLEFNGSYQSEIIEEGLAGVQGRSFFDLVKKLPAGSIDLKLDNESGNLLIEQGARKYKLPVNDPTWFQNFSEFPEEGSVYWSGDFLQELIDRIIYSVSDEDTMEAIACMSMRPAAGGGDDEGRIEVCGLNGHQFSMFSFVNDDLFALLPSEGILIQKKYISELKKWLADDEIELNISNKRLFFRTGDGSETFSLPLSYYQYPDYNNFLSKLADDGVTTVEVDRVEIIDSLDRVLIFNNDTNKCAYFEMKGNTLVLSTKGQDVGSATETLEITCKGDLERIAFPTRNLIEILGHYQSDRLTMIMTGAEGPCGIKGQEDQDYTVIIMPMKIEDETYYSEENV